MNRKIFLTKNISQYLLNNQKLNNLNKNDKIGLLKYLLNYFKYKFSINSIGYNEKYPLFAKIEFFKSIIFKNFFIGNNFCFFNNFLDNSQNLLFNNAVALDNSLYGNESNFIYTKRFKYESSLVSNKIKMYIKPMNLFIAHPQLVGKNRRKKGKLFLSTKYQYIENYLNRFVPEKDYSLLSRIVRRLRRLRVKFNSRRLRKVNKQIFNYNRNIIRRGKLRSDIVLQLKLVSKKRKR